MSKSIINATLLKSFVKKASLNGSIPSINLEFREDGLYSSVRDLVNVCLTNVYLGKKFFNEYGIQGEFFIKHTNDFMKYLKSFNDSVTITVEDNFNMCLSNDKRKIYVLMGAEIVCDNVNRKELPDFTFNAEFGVTKGFFKKAIDDMSSLKMKVLKINKKETFVSLEVGVPGESDYFINTEETDKTAEVGISLGSQVVDIFNSMDNDFKIYMMEKGVTKFEEVGEELIFTCLIAPIIEGD